MTSYHVEVKNVKGLKELKVTFDFSERNTIVVTGKNGAGKTTLVKAFKLISDPQVFKRTSSLSSIRADSSIEFSLDDQSSFSFSYNEKLRVLDTKQKLPYKNSVTSELPIPYGDRFQQFSLVARYDSEIRANIASSDYQEASDLRDFLSMVYPENERLDHLKSTKFKKYQFYFILQYDDYYIREDHFSSGEFFLIQLYRLITSGAKLIVIDELDISLDASAQVHFFSAIDPLLKKYNSNLIFVSHSLALMETVHEGDLYYLEMKNEGTTLEQRSFGYIKSDLYGFRSRDRFILTEDEVLVGFIEYVIKSNNITTFFKYEIIAVGGQPQIDAITRKNDEHEIFGPPQHVIVVVDRDIIDKIRYAGDTKIYASPVDDIEVFIWSNRENFLTDVQLDEFTPAKRDKDTAKTYWGKVINSRQKTREELYQIVIDNNVAPTNKLMDALRNHLCLPSTDQPHQKWTDQEASG